MISKLAYVDPTAKIGNNVKIHPFAYIDGDVEIGDNCEIMPYASVIHGTRMGSNNKIYQATIIGADPQDFRWKGEDTYCYIGDNNVIHEQVIINRGIRSEGGTRIGNDCFIMAQGHIGHDSVVMGSSVLGNSVKIAGNAVISQHVILSSGVIVHENCRVGEWVLVKGGTRLGANVPPYVIMAHNPACFYGVNSVVMRKRGFSETDIDNAAKAYRHIYQTQTSLYNALRRIEADIEVGEIRNAILSFIRESDLKVAGIKTQD